MITVRSICCAVVVSIATGVVAASAQAPPDQAAGATPMVEPYLLTGKLKKAQTDLDAHLAVNGQDDAARFGLGVVQFLGAIERLGGSLHTHGLESGVGRAMGIPLLRLPVAPNPNPKPIGYDDFRSIIESWVSDLAVAEATLAKITDEQVSLPLHFGRIRLDLDGDGVAGDHETLWRLYANLNRGVVRGQGEAMAEAAESFLIRFDRGDVHWLRGYCHLLSAIGEVVLAHDGRALFERTAHLFFPKVESPYGFLAQGRRVFDLGGTDVIDVIAWVHLLRLEVIEPQRMKSALAHLRSVAGQSVESWRCILNENDDDREWIPNPGQTGVIPNVSVTQEMVDGWHDFLKEFEALMAGEKLIPFWRGTEPVGVNLKKVFEQPTPFDLVLWVQGTAAAPYLEQGPLTDGNLWRRLNDVFRGQFIGFAIWFN